MSANVVFPNLYEKAALQSSPETVNAGCFVSHFLLPLSVFVNNFRLVVVFIDCFGLSTACIIILLLDSHLLPLIVIHGEIEDYFLFRQEAVPSLIFSIVKPVSIGLFIAEV
jgi:hypothetical protein